MRVYGPENVGRVHVSKVASLLVVRFAVLQPEYGRSNQKTSQYHLAEPPVQGPGSPACETIVFLAGWLRVNLSQIPQTRAASAVLKSHQYLYRWGHAASVRWSLC